MRRLFISLFAAALILPAQAESFLWVQRFGETGFCGESADKIAVDTAGNVYVVGQFCGTTDFDPGSGVFSLTAGGQDAYVLKLDSAGRFVWARPFGSAAQDVATGVAVDAAGNVIVVGTFQSTVDFDPGPGTFELTSAGNNDAFIVKLNSSGNFVWAGQIGGSTSDLARDVAVDPAGNVYTLGTFTGTADLDPGPNNVNIISLGFADIFLVKLDSGGDLVWARRMGGAGNELAAAVALDVQAPYVAGTFSGTADFDPGAGTFNLTASGTADIVVVKLDSGGNFTWARAMGGSSTSSPNDQAYDLAVDNVGIVYTVGEFSGTGDFDPGPGTFNLTAAGSAAFISKLSAGGIFLWAKQLGGATSPGPVARSVDFANGQVYAAGSFRSTSDFDPGPGTFNLTAIGLDDAFIVKLDGSGIFQWAGRIGGCAALNCGSSEDDRANAVAVSSSGNVHTTGTFRGRADFDPGSSEYELTSAAFATDMFAERLSPLQMGGTAEQLTVNKSGATALRLDWGISCTQAMPNYGVYEGQLGDFTSHFPIACFFGLTPTLTFTPLSGNRYYLVVPNDGVNVEGSFGRNSAGIERPTGAGNCASPSEALGCP